MKDFVTGDMGTSYSYQEPVKDLIADKLPVTFTMTAMAFVFILLFSIPIGLLSVRYRINSMDRQIVSDRKSGDNVDPAVFCRYDLHGDIRIDTASVCAWADIFLIRKM